MARQRKLYPSWRKSFWPSIESSWGNWCAQVWFKKSRSYKVEDEISDDAINEEKEHSSIEESIEINEINTDLEKEEDEFESFEVDDNIEGKPIDHDALDINEAPDVKKGDENDDKSSEFNKVICVNESDEDNAAGQQ